MDEPPNKTHRPDGHHAKARSVGASNHVMMIQATIPVISRSWRTVFFAINFTTALGLIALFVAGYFSGVRPALGMVLILGVLVVPVLAMGALAEWLGWYRRLIHAEVLAGVFCLFGSCAAMFVMLGKWYELEMLRSLWPSDLIWPYVVTGVFAAYGSFCGLWRLAQLWVQDEQRKPQEPCASV